MDSADPARPDHDRYRIEAAQAAADMMARLEAGGDFDRELARFEFRAQLLRERHNVFLWDGPTTARGYRHPSWRDQEGSGFVFLG